MARRIEPAPLEQLPGEQHGPPLGDWEWARIGEILLSDPAERLERNERRLAEQERRKQEAAEEAA
jgi:hypothetical protein